MSITDDIKHAVEDVIDDALKPIKSDIKYLKNKISTPKIMDEIKGVVDDSFNDLSTDFVKPVINALSPAFSTAQNLIAWDEDAGQQVKNDFQQLSNSLKETISTLGGIASSGKFPIPSGTLTCMGSLVEKVIDALEEIPDEIVGALSPLSGLIDLQGLSEASSNFTDTLQSVLSDTTPHTVAEGLGTSFDPAKSKAMSITTLAFIATVSAVANTVNWATSSIPLGAKIEVLAGVSVIVDENCGTSMNVVNMMPLILGPLGGICNWLLQIASAFLAMLKTVLA